MPNFPANDAFAYPASPGDLTNNEFADLMEQILVADKELPGALEQTEITISAGSITVDRCSHSIDTQSDASTDDLTNIATGSSDVRLLILRVANPARVVTVKHAAGGIGEILLDGAADYVFNKASKTLILERIGAQWLEVTRTGWDDAEDGGQQLFTASGTFNIPMGITRVYVTAIGGAGGGGGGAGATGTSPSSSTDGADGSGGGSSAFGSLTVAGGGGGGKGQGLGRGGAALSGGGHGGNKVGDLGGIGGIAAPTILAGYGKGGAGGAGSGGTAGTGGGGGGSGSCSAVPVVRQKVDSLTPGGTVAVTVGTGGALGAGGTGAGGNGAAGSTGASGAVLVEW